MKSAKIGAMLFVFWGLLHVVGGGAILSAALASPDRGFAFYDPAAADYSRLAGDVLAYLAFGFVWIGLLVTAVGARYNWRNDRQALALNTALVGCTDLGLVLFLVWPGHLSWLQASPGLLSFAGAVLFSGWACRSAHAPATAPA
ncbi:MAG: hypothetical protein R3233_09870 [Xanthomonadales bacterium]|nr:hypothetical protein [Xanthomonadales bacterium]